MKLATTGWMERAGRNYYRFTNKKFRECSHLCSDQLSGALGVSLDEEDKYIRITMYSHYVPGSNEMLVLIKYVLEPYDDPYGYGEWNFVDPVTKMTFGDTESDRVLQKCKTFIKWMGKAKKKTVYLLTETK